MSRPRLLSVRHEKLKIALKIYRQWKFNRNTKEENMKKTIWFSLLVIVMILINICGFFLIIKISNENFENSRKMSDLNFRYLKYEIACLDKDADIVQLTREYLIEGSKHLPESEGKKLIERFENDVEKFNREEK
jgi:hypothetical protein